MSLLVLKYAFAALIHSNILFSLQIYLGPSIHSKHALFNLISPSNLQCQVFFSSNVPLHFESTQIIPFSNQMEHYAYKPLKSNHPQLKCAVDSQTIQIMLSSRQMAHCTLEPLKSCPLQLKCIFAPLKPFKSNLLQDKWDIAPSNHLEWALLSSNVSLHCQYTQTTFNTLIYAQLHSTNSNQDSIASNIYSSRTNIQCNTYNLWMCTCTPIMLKISKIPNLQLMFQTSTNAPPMWSTP